MCGAAAESILLAAAIAKSGDEQGTLQTYRCATGRSKVENSPLGQASTYVREGYRSFSGLLKYWRDEAAHGTASSISDNEAYTSLALLLRHAMFVADNWRELTGQDG